MDGGGPEPNQAYRRVLPLRVPASRTGIDVFRRLPGGQNHGRQRSPFGSLSFPGMPYPVTPVPYTDPRSFWLGPAVLGILLVQFLLLALLAWKTLVPGSSEPVGAPPPRGRTAVVAVGSDVSVEVDRVSREAEIQLRLLDRIVDQLGQGTGRGLVPLLEQLQQENEAMKADSRVYRTLEAKVKAENEALVTGAGGGKRKQAANWQHRWPNYRTRSGRKTWRKRITDQRSHRSRSNSRPPPRRTRQLWLATGFASRESWPWPAPGSLLRVFSRGRRWQPGNANEDLRQRERRGRRRIPPR